MRAQPLSASPRDERYPLPIYLFLTALAVWAVSGTVISTPALQAWLPVTLIGGLLLLHLRLHWHSPRLAQGERAWVQYALAQGGLAAALTLATNNPSVWAPLFSWLVGEVVGMLGKPRLTAVSLALYGSLAVAALFAITDRATAIEWLGAILPTSLFIGLVVVLYKRQVEAREQAQRLIAELEAANRQVSAYAARVEELTVANERQRMARELHDTLAQDVAGLVLQLEAVHAHLDRGRHEKARAIVEQAMTRARATLHTARAAIDDLRACDAPARLNERLETLCRRFSMESDVPCDFSGDAGMWETALPEVHREHIERILSEALSNIRRHAGATRVTVTCRAMPGGLSLRIEDNGAGFDSEKAPAKGHYGLSGLRERAALLNGTLIIRSAPAQGTSISLDIPLGPTGFEGNTPSIHPLPAAAKEEQS